MKKVVSLRLNGRCPMLYSNCAKSTPTPSETEQSNEEQNDEHFEQSSDDHLTFKGVAIDGSLSGFVSRMKSAGFSEIGTEDGVSILRGDFAGCKGCTIVVSTLSNLDVVNAIGVIFPKKDDWVSLEKDYQTIKKLLTEKYGKPSECVEEFQSDETPSDNWFKLHALEMGECLYVTSFETPKGDIRLSLEHHDFSCFVKLQYWDRINTDSVKAKVMEEL